MQAKSFLGEMREAARHFYMTGIRDEVSDATIQGYLRAASQIEDIWQQIDEQLATLISQGVAPWEAYAQLRYPLAFILILNSIGTSTGDMSSSPGVLVERVTGRNVHLAQVPIGANPA